MILDSTQLIFAKDALWLSQNICLCKLYFSLVLLYLIVRNKVNMAKLHKMVSFKYQDKCYFKLASGSRL